MAIQQYQRILIAINVHKHSNPNYRNVSLKKYHDNLNNDVNSLNVSDRYNIRPQSINKEYPTFINTKDDIIDFIKSYNTECIEDLQIVPIIYNDYLDTLLFGIINNFGYTPEIKMMSGKITSPLVNTIMYYSTLHCLTQKQMIPMFGSTKTSLSYIILLMMHFITV